MKAIVATFLFFIGGCAGSTTSAPPASPAPSASASMVASSTPSASAAPVDPAPPPTASAKTQPPPPSDSPKPNPGFPPPENFVWIDTRAGFALAAKEPAAFNDVACEVIEIATAKVVAKITGENTNAGGANPSCEQLSPGGHFVSIGNGRGMFWKNWKNKTTACRGVVAPDDSSCMEDDVTPFMFAGTGGPAADLDLHWSKPIVNGPVKKVVTIPRGLNRDGSTRKWWSVEYCSPSVVIVDDTKGKRTTIDATHGTVKSTKKSDGSPLCP